MAKRKKTYPIGLLDGRVEIHFLHYKSEQEAFEKWQKRKMRVDFDNLIIIGMEQNWCTEPHIRQFDTLPYERKFFFSTKDLPDVQSNICMHQYSNEIGNAYNDCRIFYKELIKRL